MKSLSLFCQRSSQEEAVHKLHVGGLHAISRGDVISVPPELSRSRNFRLTLAWVTERSNPISYRLFIFNSKNVAMVHKLHDAEHIQWTEGAGFAVDLVTIFAALRNKPG